MSSAAPSGIPVRSRPRSGVNDMTGVGSLQDRQAIEGKDLRPCLTRVSPTERIRGHIDELFAADRPLGRVTATGR